MADDVKSTVRRLYEVVNAGNLDLMDELLADDFVEHEEFPGFSPDRDGVKKFFEMAHAAFDGLRMEVEELVVDGDKVAVRATLHGTHKGEFLGIPATGKTVAVPLADFARVGSDGKLAEHWGVMDNLILMQQLGLVPEEPPTG
jgi:steroid delta-isomerase-like uncharacterized protein